MKKSGSNELHELLWRSNLTQAEELRLKQLLAAEPEAKEEVVFEERLNQALDSIPEIPVSSNFTALVMGAVELENLRHSRKGGWPAWRAGFGWVSRLAMAGFILAAGIFGFHRYHANQQLELAQSVASLSNVGAVPPGWLEDFDTIKNLSSASAVDDELLAALR